MTSTRRLAGVFLVASLLVTLQPAKIAAAQEGSLTSITTAVDILYGDRLVFHIDASASATLSGARLTAEVAGTDRIISEVVTLTPGLTISVSHELSVDTLQLPPFAEIIYFWDFQDQNGVAYQTPPVTVWYEDTSVPWEWQQLTQANITVLTNGRSEPVSAATLDIATQSLTAAERSLGAPYEGQMRIYVYPDLAAMSDALTAHSVQIQDWVAGYAIPSQQVAMISASEGPALADTLHLDVPHEVSHLVVAQLMGGTAKSLPGWFNEGMALSASGDIDPTLRTVLAEANANHRLLPLADLCAPQFSSLSHQTAQLAYAQSASVFRYVSEQYGAARVRAMLEAFRGGASCEGAVQQSLGISLAKLESQWHNGIVEQSSTGLPASESIILWIVVWAVSAGLALLFLAPQTTQSQDVVDETQGQDHTRPLRSVNRPDAHSSG